MIKKKHERIIWLSITSLLSATLIVLIFSPIASAQSRGSKSVRAYLNSIETAFQIIHSNYVDPTDDSKLFRGAMQGLFDSLDDPNSSYLDEEVITRMNDTTVGKYGGLGLYISRDSYRDEDEHFPYVRIISPIEGTPGWKSGINAGDYIYAINDESAKDFTTDNVSDRLRGLPGTDVKVTLLRDESFTFDAVLTREEIEIPTVKSEIIKNEIGYLRIIQFTPFTASRVENTLKEFSRKNLKNQIIDLRSNPGGLLSSAIDVVDLFFSGGIIVSTKYRKHGLDRVYKADPGTVVNADVKMVVLIDKGSASASEILTGALKDRKRATVIGETSFGKGSIQQIIPFNGEAIKITTGRYYTPNGTNIDKTGIKPDIVVTQTNLTEGQADSYAKLIKEGRIEAFIKGYPSPTEQQISNFIQSLSKEGFDIGDKVLRILVKQVLNRKLNKPPVIDLELDSTLIQAIKYLENEWN